MQSLFLLRRYIQLVYDQYILVISHQLHASWPCWSWQRAGTNQTWTGCRSFKFQWQKALQFEDGACQRPKVPPPCVALANMTAPAGSLPLTISTPKLIRLFWPRCAFVLNRRCGVSFKKALKEWHPSKKVPNSANIVNRDRRGFAKLSNAIFLHGTRGLKVKILQSTEKRTTSYSPIDF